MRIAVARETDAGEPRVAATPETVKKLIALGAEVAVEPGAGVGSGIPDADFEAAGANVGDNVTKDADVVLKVRRPTAAELAGYKKGALVIAIMDPYGNDAALKAMADAGIIAFAMELMPRITRAQSMDVLSSQANLAGYRAVIDAAAEYGRALPMMMTAAGTVPAAKVFVMGVGVAGLQAIATARRLGAIVTATDVRPADEGAGGEPRRASSSRSRTRNSRTPQTAGGYAKEMSKEYQAKQAALVAEHIKKQDIVITTALIPGRPAPRLVTKEMVASMRPGSVIVDLAVERGGNVEGAKPGEVAEVGGVKIVGYLNVPGRLAASASALYAKNLLTFLETLIDKKDKKLAINWDDEIVKGTALTRDGAVVHPNFEPKTRRESSRCRRRHPPASREASSCRRPTRARSTSQGEEAKEGSPNSTAVDPFVFRLSIFVLAVFVGYYVVWSVTPALHTPLMSVTNAISSVIVVGALLAVGVALVADDKGTVLRARPRLRRARLRLDQHLRRLPGHPAHAGDVPEEERSERDDRQPRRAALSRRRRPLHPGAARAVDPGIRAGGQSVRHDRHGDRHRHHARRASAGRYRPPGCWSSAASPSAAASAR